MIRFAILALCVAACGRSHGVSDQDLPGLVVEAKQPEPPIDVERAARDPVELGRALARPYRVMLAALGAHSVAVNTAMTVEEAGKQVSDLSDHAQIDNGTGGAFHAIYDNSADYGREATFVDGKLYLRPRYQRWHARAPEAPDEPAELRDHFFDGVSATWDLVSPGVELVDRGAVQVAGRAGRKIEVKRAAEPREPAAESVVQRKWRESRRVEAVAGEVVLDTERGVPLTVKLSGSVAFSRDGRRFTMKLTLDSAVSGLGTPAPIVPPADGDIVATPERLREVDDRDFLLQGIAPPLRRNPDGTAIPPAPRFRDGGGSASAGSAAPGPTTAAPADKSTDKSRAPGKRKGRGDDPPRRRGKPDEEARP